jgi:hypothetical protein
MARRSVLRPIELDGYRLEAVKSAAKRPFARAVKSVLNRKFHYIAALEDLGTQRYSMASFRSAEDIFDKIL